LDHVDILKYLLVFDVSLLFKSFIVFAFKTKKAAGFINRANIPINYTKNKEYLRQQFTNPCLNNL